MLSLLQTLKHLLDVTTWMATFLSTVFASNFELCLFQDGSCIEPSSVFKVYTEKLFWEGEQKNKESEADQPVSLNKVFLFVSYVRSAILEHRNY